MTPPPWLAEAMATADSETSNREATGEQVSHNESVQAARDALNRAGCNCTWEHNERWNDGDCPIHPKDEG